MPHMIAGTIVAHADSKVLLYKRAKTMELRNHPLMSFRGRPNWPPEWIQSPTQNGDTATGEVGILEEVYYPSVLDPSRCYVTITHRGRAYFGVLRFDDTEFCQKISELLLQNLTREIEEIAASDVC